MHTQAANKSSMGGTPTKKQLTIALMVETKGSPIRAQKRVQYQLKGSLIFYISFGTLAAQDAFISSFPSNAKCTSVVKLCEEGVCFSLT